MQNSAARLLTSTHKFAHITPFHIQVHWLPVKFRIDFKILLLTRHLNTYVYESQCNLRSLAHDNLLLVEPKTRLASYGDRAFCKAAPKLWNRLPRDNRHSKSINSFKCSLDTSVRNGF